MGCQKPNSAPKTNLDRRLIYKTLKDHHHWRLHALSRAIGVLSLAAHVPPRAAEPPRSLEIVVPGIYSDQRPPPTDRSSPDLSLYGGKIVIGGGTRLHMSMGTLASLFTCCRGLQTPELSLPSFDSESRTTIRVLSGRFAVWHWNCGHRSLHAPPRAVEAPAKFSTLQHVRARSSVCEAHATTLLAHA
uniref:Uncharacterized protein n=1 Tax=Fagus sylvatica TaxID=28930 RepID=A0A2N9EFG0_FAGSY